MEFKAVDKFPHNQIISGSKINPSDLDEDIKTVITSFNRKHNGYKMKPTEGTEKELMALSRLISQNIYDYYVDKDDQDTEIKSPEGVTPTEIKEIVKDIKEEQSAPAPAPVIVEPTPAPEPKPAPVEVPVPGVPAPPVAATEAEPTNKNEKALYLLFKEGTTTGITKRMLSEKGFNTDIASIRGCKVGGYRLFKEFSDTAYNLEKI